MPLLGLVLLVAAVFVGVVRLYELAGGKVFDDYIVGFQSSRLAGRVSD